MPILDRFTSGSHRVASAARTAQAVAAREASRLGGRGLAYGVIPNGSGVEFPDINPADRICGAPGCTSGWLKPWKSRRRPVFEGDWGCSARCLDTLVSQAVRRETADATPVVVSDVHRHRVPLGLVLLAQGWITHPQLQSALAAQRSAGQGRIGEWLVRTCGLPEDRIARGLGVQWNCPVLSMDGFSARSMALVMPKRFIAEFGLVPIRAAGSKMLYLAFQDGPNAPLALSLEQMSVLKVESGLLPATQFEAARSQVLQAESVSVRVKLVPDLDRMGAAVVKLLEQRQPVASRFVRVHHYYWLRFWLEEGALALRGGVPASAEDVEDHIFMMA